MMSLQEILSSPVAQRIGFALMHSLWQCTAIAVLFAVVMLALRNRRPQVRYNVAITALLLMVIVPVITVFAARVDDQTPPAAVVEEPVAPAALVEPAEVVKGGELPVVETSVVFPDADVADVAVVSEKDVAAANSASIGERIEIVLPYLAIGWIVGVLILSVWHLGGWAQLRRLRRVMVKPVEEYVSEKLALLAQSLAVKRTVEIVESALVTVPTVIGALKPVILLPASALTGLSTEQLEAILAHELAHIKRNDYLMNLIQTAIDILLFYHPAAWYISRKIRNERENCCDDIAVQVTGDSLKYARALATMEEIKAASRRLAVAASGGNLFDRISRIVSKEEKKQKIHGWLTAAITIIIAAAITIPAMVAVSAEAKDIKTNLTVTGTVTDAQTGKPIQGAKISDKTYNGGNQGAVSDAKGKYSYQTWYEEHSVITKAKGYESQTKTLKTKLVGSEKEVSIDFQLQPEKTSIPPSPFKATLANGVELELIGLCANPSTGKQWWRPDGSVLKARPYDKTPCTHVGPPVYYDYVCRLTGGEDLQLKKNQAGCGPSRLSERGVNINLPDQDSLYHCTLQDYNRLKQTDLTLLVGSESSWKTVTSMDSPSEVGMSTIDNVIIMPPVEKNAVTYIDVVASRVDEQFRVIAIDNNGKKYVGGGMSCGGNLGSAKVISIRAQFPLLIANIKSIEYQTQKFIPVTFKNVSLKPGHKTKVEIDIAPTKSKTPSRKPGNADMSKVGLLGYRFADSSTVRSALELVSKVGKVNIIPSEQVDLTAALPFTSLYDVTFEQALQAVIGKNKFVKEGNFIKVYTPEEYAALYGFDPVKAKASLKVVEGIYSSVDGIEFGKDTADYALKTMKSALEELKYLTDNSKGTPFHPLASGLSESWNNTIEQLSKGNYKKAKIFFETIGDFGNNAGNVLIKAVEEKMKAASTQPAKITKTTTTAKAAPTENPLDMKIDFSFVKTDTTFEEVVKYIRSQRTPPLQIVVLWSSLSDIAFVDRDCTVNIDGLGTTTLKTGLALILKAISSPEVGSVVYEYQDGIIAISAKQRPKSPAPAAEEKAKYATFVCGPDGLILGGKKIENPEEILPAMKLIEDRENTILQVVPSKEGLESDEWNANKATIIAWSKEAGFKDVVFVDPDQEPKKSVGQPVSAVDKNTKYATFIGTDDGAYLSGKKVKSFDDLSPMIKALDDKSNTILQIVLTKSMTKRDDWGMIKNSLMAYAKEYGLKGVEFVDPKAETETPAPVADENTKYVSFLVDENGAYLSGKKIESFEGLAPAIKALKDRGNTILQVVPTKEALQGEHWNMIKSSLLAFGKEFGLKQVVFIDPDAEIKNTAAPDDKNAKHVTLLWGSGSASLAGKKIEDVKELIEAFKELKDRANTILLVTPTEEVLKDKKWASMRHMAIAWGKEFGFKRVAFTNEDTIDKSKAAEIIGKWARALEFFDLDVIEGLIASCNEQTLSAFFLMSPTGGKVRPVPEIKGDPVILKITKIGDGRYRVLSLTIDKELSYYLVNNLLIKDGAVKVDFDLNAQVKKMQDVRTMSASEYGERLMKEQFASWKNAEGKELAKLSEEMIQKIDDRIIAAEYAEKNKIKIAGASNTNTAELRAEKKKLEKMTPVQIRDMVLKEFNEFLQQYSNTKPAKAPDTPDDSNMAHTNNSSADDSKPLKFLSGIREFKDLRLNITEQALRRHLHTYSIAATFIELDDSVVYHLYTEKGENVFVTFRQGECAGIQRMRKDLGAAAKLHKHWHTDRGSAGGMYFEACRFYSEGGKRPEAVKRFFKVADLSPATEYGARAREIARLLIDMKGEKRPVQKVSKHDVTITLEQHFESLIFDLRDLSRNAYTIPGKCRVLFLADSSNPAMGLKKLAENPGPDGQLVIRRLINMLDDPRPTRSWAGAMNGGHVYRNCDVALEILSVLADNTLPTMELFFDRRSGRDYYLGNADNKTRKEIIAKVKAWYAKNRGIDPAKPSAGKVSDANVNHSNLPEKITFTLVDESGKPVSGAAIGNHFYPYGKAIGGKPRLIWARGVHNTTGVEGKVTARMIDMFGKYFRDDRKFELCVYDESRKLGYWQKLSRSEMTAEMTLELSPVCRVRGDFICKGYDRKNDWYLDASMELGCNGKRIFSNNARRDDFDLLLFAGKYYIDATGIVYNEELSLETGRKRIEFEVKEGQHELELRDIDLPVSKIAGLVGKPAPKLGPVKSWHNGDAVKLSVLKGKTVLLYFGGDSASASGLNRLVNLHNEFAEHGLEILVVYNADNMASLQETWKEDNKPAADFMKRMEKAHKSAEEMLKTSGRKIPKRDAPTKYYGPNEVPFRVAIDSGVGSVYDGGDVVRRDSTYQVFGIERKTSVVLIDKEGKVVGNLNLNDADARETIARMLGVEIEKKAPKSGPGNEIPQWPKPVIYSMSGTGSRKLAAING